MNVYNSHTVKYKRTAEKNDVPFYLKEFMDAVPTVRIVSTPPLNEVYLYLPIYL